MVTVSPEVFARRQFELAGAILTTPQGFLTAGLEQAIGLFEQGLKAYTPRINPEWRITALANLATAYTYRTEGDRKQSLERAIKLYKQVLSSVSEQSYPEYWGEAQNGLGVAYRKRVQGDPAANLERAIQHLKTALGVFSRQTHPVQWARVQNNLGNVYRDRIRGSRADNLEKAIGHYQQAIEGYGSHADERSLGEARKNLAVIFTIRIKGVRAENVERAIELFGTALESLPAQLYPRQYAETQAGLASAYLERTCGERADNIEHAIESYEGALKVLRQESYLSAWAHIKCDLGAAYNERICGDFGQNQELAIRHLEEALKEYSHRSDPKWWTLTHNNLGSAYSTRLYGLRANNLEQSIKHFREALATLTRAADPQVWGVINDNLATTHMKRRRGRRARNIEQAIVYCERALESLSRRSHPVNWARAKRHLANMLVERILGDRSDNIARAMQCFLEAQQVFSRLRLTAEVQDTQKDLGNLYFVQGRWREARVAFDKAILAEKALLASAYTEAGRKAEVAETSGLYPRAAYALLKLGRRAGEALVQLEQGKTRLLSRALALDELDVSVLPVKQREALHGLRHSLRSLEAEMRLPPDTPARRDDRTLAQALKRTRAELNDAIESAREAHPEFMPEGLALAQILALIPKEAALVALMVTSQGSAVLAVPSGMSSVSLENVLWLDGFNEADLRALLQGADQETAWGGWLGAYFNARTEPKAWHDTIGATTRALWDRLMGPVAERLATLGVRHVLLMPQGGLGLLPLHAAWREAKGKRRYFLDDYTVTYVASAYARRVSLDRLHDAPRQARTLLAIVNPTEDLPFTPAEGEQVARLFGDKRSTRLPGSHATLEAVKQAVASYLHFACHGFYSWVDPMQSGLVLAQGEPLTLAQITSGLNLDATRLVTLSACETGITDIRQSPDEYLGLPAGFLQAGAPAVVSTLWAVNDLSTMLLMERFYRVHLEENQDLPEALRQAKCWVRDVTAAELAKRFAEEKEAAFKGNPRMPIETASAAFARFASQDPEHRPFEHPFYWAAFTFSGA